MACFYGVNRAPVPRGAELQPSPILGFSIYGFTLQRRMVTFGKITHVGSGVLLVVFYAYTVSRGGGAPALPNFGVPLYLKY